MSRRPTQKNGSTLLTDGRVSIGQYVPPSLNRAVFPEETTSKGKSWFNDINRGFFRRKNGKRVEFNKDFKLDENATFNDKARLVAELLSVNFDDPFERKKLFRFLRTYDQNATYVSNHEIQCLFKKADITFSPTKHLKEANYKNGVFTVEVTIEQGNYIALMGNESLPITTDEQQPYLVTHEVAFDDQLGLFRLESLNLSDNMKREIDRLTKGFNSPNSVDYKIDIFRERVLPLILMHSGSMHDVMTRITEQLASIEATALSENNEKDIHNAVCEASFTIQLYGMLYGELDHHLVLQDVSRLLQLSLVNLLDDKLRRKIDATIGLADSVLKDATSIVQKFKEAARVDDFNSVKQSMEEFYKKESECIDDNTAKRFLDYLRNYVVSTCKNRIHENHLTVNLSQLCVMDDALVLNDEEVVQEKNVIGEATSKRLDCTQYFSRLAHGFVNEHNFDANKKTEELQTQLQTYLSYLLGGGDSVIVEKDSSKCKYEMYSRAEGPVEKRFTFRGKVKHAGSEVGLVEVTLCSPYDRAQCRVELIITDPGFAKTLTSKAKEDRGLAYSGSTLTAKPYNREERKCRLQPVYNDETSHPFDLVYKLGSLLDQYENGGGRRINNTRRQRLTYLKALVAAYKELDQQGGLTHADTSAFMAIFAKIRQQHIRGTHHINRLQGNRLGAILDRVLDNKMVKNCQQKAGQLSGMASVVVERHMESVGIRDKAVMKRVRVGDSLLYQYEKDMQLQLMQASSVEQCEAIEETYLENYDYIQEHHRKFRISKQDLPPVYYLELILMSRIFAIYKAKTADQINGIRDAALVKFASFASGKNLANKFQIKNRFTTIINTASALCIDALEKERPISSEWFLKSLPRFKEVLQLVKNFELTRLDQLINDKTSLSDAIQAWKIKIEGVFRPIRKAGEAVLKMGIGQNVTKAAQPFEVLTAYFNSIIIEFAVHAIHKVSEYYKAEFKGHQGLNDVAFLKRLDAFYHDLKKIKDGESKDSPAVQAKQEAMNDILGMPDVKDRLVKVLNKKRDIELEKLAEDSVTKDTLKEVRDELVSLRVRFKGFGLKDEATEWEKVRDSDQNYQGGQAVFEAFNKFYVTCNEGGDPTYEKFSAGYSQLSEDLKQAVKVHSQGDCWNFAGCVREKLAEIRQSYSKFVIKFEAQQLPTLDLKKAMTRGHKLLAEALELKNQGVMGVGELAELCEEVDRLTYGRVESEKAALSHIESEIGALSKDSFKVTKMGLLSFIDGVFRYSLRSSDFITDAGLVRLVALLVEKEKQLYPLAATHASSSVTYTTAGMFQQPSSGDKGGVNDTSVPVTRNNNTP